MFFSFSRSTVSPMAVSSQRTMARYRARRSSSSPLYRRYCGSGTCSGPWIVCAAQKTKSGVAASCAAMASITCRWNSASSKRHVPSSIGAPVAPSTGYGWLVVVHSSAELFMPSAGPSKVESCRQRSTRSRSGAPGQLWKLSSARTWDVQ